MLPRSKQESCDPDMGKRARARARCSHDGRGSPGSDAISAKCPVDHRKFGETINYDEMGDEIFLGGGGAGVFLDFCHIHMQQQSLSE